MTNSAMLPLPIICLLGPTASGKTALAIHIAKHFPCEIISVDSAMVYRGLNIGTAKPDSSVLQTVPHHLIDILDPAESYSAGQFRIDALYHIQAILARGKIPLLVGGTMLYFRILQQGLAPLPQADALLRTRLQERARQEGWLALHAELAAIDPSAAKRIHCHDSQRIQRALEVYQLTGQTITAWQTANTSPLSGYSLYHLAITPAHRAILHDRIATRFTHMLSLGLVEEVRQLYLRQDLSPDLPAIRSVGYRQVWSYLAGELTYDEMREKAIAATRQLAKRQLTWLRSWNEMIWFDSEADNLFSQVKRKLEEMVFKKK